MNPDEIILDLVKYAKVDYTAINELTDYMNITKLTNEQILHSSIRNNEFIIGSWNPGSGISFTANPTTHYTAAQARAECKRLAKLNPGKTFVFVELSGAEKVIPQPTSVSI